MFPATKISLPAQTLVVYRGQPVTAASKAVKIRTAYLQNTSPGPQQAGHPLYFNFFVYLLFTNRTRRMCRFFSLLRLRLCLSCYYLRPQKFGNTLTDAGRSSAERHVAPL